MRERRPDHLPVALVIPLQGPAGIFGPSCEACAELAAEEVNREGGVLGRQVRFVVVDGGAGPRRVADEVDALVTSGRSRPSPAGTSRRCARRSPPG
jgi:urea transport system substrate-binding protein